MNKLQLKQLIKKYFDNHRISVGEYAELIKLVIQVKTAEGLKGVESKFEWFLLERSCEFIEERY